MIEINNINCRKNDKLSKKSNINTTIKYDSKFIFQGNYTDVNSYGLGINYDFYSKLYDFSLGYSLITDPDLKEFDKDYILSPYFDISFNLRDNIFLITKIIKYDFRVEEIESNIFYEYIIGVDFTKKIHYYYEYTNQKDSDFKYSNNLIVYNINNNLLLSLNNFNNSNNVEILRLISDYYITDNFYIGLGRDFVDIDNEEADEEFNRIFARLSYKINF